MRTARFSAALGAAAALTALATHARAQLLPPPTGVLSPGRALAADGDASAVSVNPADLALLPSGELRYTYVGVKDEAVLAGRGHAVDLAAPLFWRLYGGLRADFVQPTHASGLSDYRWLTTALAMGSRDGASIGVTLARSYSDTPVLDGHWVSTVGLTWWALPQLAVAGVIRDWNGYQNATRASFDRTYDLGLTLRPTGTRVIEISGEARHSEEQKRWVPRGVLGFDVPFVGRIRGEVDVDYPGDDARRVYTATAGLDLMTGPLALGGGAIFGSALGPGGKVGGYFDAAVRGFGEPGTSTPPYSVRMRLESTPDAREHVRLLRSLWRAAEAPGVEAVALILKTEPASSLAHAEELGDAVRMLRSRGKKVVCHLESAGPRALHVCSQADRVVINPNGAIGFAGLSAHYLYFADLLTRVGVRADFVRIGAHKSAPEQFTRGGPTPTAEGDVRDLIAQNEGVLLSDVGGGRRIALDELRARVARGPFDARQAKAAGLVDGLAYDDELGGAVAEAVGHTSRLVDADDAPVFAKRAPLAFGPRGRVALVYLEGDMIDGRSRTIPLVGGHLAGSYTVAKALRDAREDGLTRAVVLRVESPGGSSLAADVIWREVAQTAKVKPVIVSMGSTAASGGYYAAAGGDVIFANRTTLTGSIGVFAGKPDIEGLLGKIGVGVASYRTGPHADLDSIFRPFSDDERELLGRNVKRSYDTFVDRVARGRHMTPDAVDAVARGHVWTGEQARERGLVDRLGGLREALAEARKRAGLDDDAPLVELPKEPTSLLETLLSIAGVTYAPSAEAAGGALPLPPALAAALRGLAPFAYFDQQAPLMRLEQVAVDAP